jgi:hypothetical protein
MSNLRPTIFALAIIGCAAAVNAQSVQDAKIRDHRQSPTTTQAGGPSSDQTRPARPTTGQVVKTVLTPGAIPLTQAECESLGGRVESFAVCKGVFGTIGGKACFTTDQYGKAHAVCIERAKSSARQITPSPRAPGPAGRGQLSAAGDTVIAPLTSQECKGLGGKVISTNKCSAKGHQTCSTVDRHGVVRVACIDEVSDD